MTNRERLIKNLIGSLKPWFALLILLAASSTSRSQDSLTTEELKQRSLEELMEISVTSVSRTPQPLFETPAAVSVITQNDIRRSGARTLPGILRLVPTLQVAQIDSRQWAISARGFNSTAANKLLVLIDGRSVYTPLYSGVFWDVQQVLSDDIERIEVISGPGGTLWGANAVNGIINVVTKSALSTPGLLAHAEAGTDRQLFGGLQYGGRISETGTARAYVMGIRRGDSRLPSGDDGGDGWNFVQGGARADWDLNGAERFTFQQDVYSGMQFQPNADDIDLSGGDAMLHWNHEISETSEIEVSQYVDKTHRKIPGTFTEDLETYDFDFQHRIAFSPDRSFVWGLGFRYSDDNVEPTPVLAFLPPYLATRLYSGFVQDEIAMIPNRLRMTLGLKLEHNSFSNFEVQPSVRFSWLLSESQMVWWALTRAVRTPSRIDRDFYAPGTPPFLLAGGPGFVSEKLIAYEAGYRLRSGSLFSFDVAAFFNSYSDLRSVEPGPPYFISNGLEGTTYGLELSATYQAARWWYIRAGYTNLQKDIHPRAGSLDINNGQGEGNDPKHQLSILSMFDLPRNFELDCWFRAVSELPNTGSEVPAYATLDVQLGWHNSQSLSIFVVGKNLLHDQHPEFGAPSTRKEIQRGAYVKVEWVR